MSFESDSLTEQSTIQKQQQNFQDHHDYPFKTLEQFQKKQIKNIKKLSYQNRTDEQIKNYIKYIENNKQIAQDREIIDIIKNQDFDFNDILKKEKQKEGVKTFTGYKDKYIQKLIKKKQTKEYKQTKNIAAKQLEENILQQIDELNSKNGKKFMKFTEQIKLYNQFYSIFIYEKEDQFQDFISNHQLEVQKNKIFQQQQQPQQNRNSIIQKKFTRIGYECNSLKTSNKTIQYKEPPKIDQYDEDFFDFQVFDKELAAEFNNKLEIKIQQAKQSNLNPEQFKYFDKIKSGDLKDLQVMLQVDPSLIKAIDNMSMNGLHIGILRKQIPIIQFLIELGIDIKHKDIANRTPFDLANEQEPTFTNNKIKSILNDAIKPK